MGRQRRTCRRGTLHGTYLFHDQGFDDETGRTFAGAGYEYFDGNGHIHGVFSHHDYHEVSIRRAPITGTYRVNPDCTGTSTYPEFGSEYDLFISPDGEWFTWVAIEPHSGAGVSGVERRVSRERVGQ